MPRGLSCEFPPLGPVPECLRPFFLAESFFPEVHNWCTPPPFPLLTGLLTQEFREVCISGQATWLEASFRPLPPSEDREGSSFYPAVL